MQENISIIVAYSRNRVIGKNNQLIWKISSDLKHFKQLTMGCPIIMGRKTWESIGRPLPGRVNIVITGQRNYQPEGVEVVHSLEQAIEVAREKSKTIFIIGGGQIYQQGLKFAHHVYATEIHTEIEGDTYFPTLSENEWIEIDRQTQPEDNGYLFDFVTYQRLT